MKYVLSEDKAQEKGKRIVVNCYYYFSCQIIIQYVSMNNTFGCCGCELTLFSDHFIVHFFCTKMSFFLLWTLKMMHVFPRGLSVNFLIAILKRFLVILSIFPYCL